MSYELVITEKPSAGKKIADSLADSKATKRSVNGVAYYELKHNGNDVVVACAVGHLYTLEQKNKGKTGWTYPVFDIKWIPSYEKKGSEYTRKYLDVISKLAKKAKSFVVATDYDIEGEVIGLNVVRFACNAKDAKRMKYSTLTKDELISSYENANKHLDWGQARAGETRHFLDWLYGINLSRALTLSIKNGTGRYKIMSSGRVQGPALKIVVDKEKDILKFVPKPFWEIDMKYQKGRKHLTANHKTEKFWKKDDADIVLKNTKGHDARVAKISTKEQKHPPPFPFDLTTLQTEAYRCFGMPPKRTLEIAQELYIAGNISYPRTSSQKLPPSIGLKKIISSLAKSSIYGKFASRLLADGTLKPNEGPNSDPAHPAIFPTGILPGSLAQQQSKVYDLVVKRFFSTFGEWAKRETLTVNFDVNKEPFITKGSKTTYKGWYEFYDPYVKLDEVELPDFTVDEVCKVLEVKQHEKETQPPKRYTEASIIKELEKRGLGTKATRAAIVDALYERKYITTKPMGATDLGIKTVNILHKYCPQILEEELTRDIEDDMEEIRNKDTNESKVIEKAEKVLTEVLNTIKTKEKTIGKELGDATFEMEKKMNTLGECPVCHKGNLVIKRGKYGRFVACDRYPDCTATLKIPQQGMIKPLGKVCEHCGYPVIRIGKEGGRPRELCVNPNCKSKQIQDSEIKHEAKEIVNGSVEKECPKCGNPLILRTSLYGKFLGCSTFPKCKYMESIKDGPLKEDFSSKSKKSKGTSSKTSKRTKK
ncbi:MAG: DNA topoisomerase I [Nanoarchaeota archaeon]